MSEYQLCISRCHDLFVEQLVIDVHVIMMSGVNIR